MNTEAIMFYIISAFILGTGVLAVTSSKIFRAAIWLLASLVGVAALYFWMSLEFIAAVQIVVYAGGIVVLIIFSIFLTQNSGEQLPAPLMRRKLFGALAAVAGFLFIGNLLLQYGFPAGGSKPFALTIQTIGYRLLDTTGNGYLLPFEVVSMLLLAAMVGCIVIAMKHPDKTPVAIDPTSQAENKPVPEYAIAEPITEEV